MTVFWIVASLLIAGSLALLLPPLVRRRTHAAGVSRKATNIAVYRDQLRELEQDHATGVVSREGYEESRREIERRLLEDVGDAEESPHDGTAGRNAAVVLGGVIPIIAFALYFAVGSFESLLPGRAGAGSEQASHSIGEDQIRELAARLAARLEKEPDNLEGWAMLARSYAAVGEFDKAARAYGTAVARAGDDAALLADYADALAMAQGRSLQGEPEKIIHRALAIDPQNVKALALAGTAAFDRKEYAGAVQYWERILKVAPENSEFAQSVRSSIAEAQHLAQQGGGAPAAASVPIKPAAPAAPAVATATKSVSGVVQVAPPLVARVSPNDTVFVYARAVDGPRMPLAIVRAKAKELPLKFTLDDRSAMTEAMKLSGQERVVVGARISKSGSATPQAGDLEGLSAPVAVGAQGVEVVVNSETK